MPDETKEAGLEPSRIKVLFIAGWGHSGSTLLDLILGASENVVSVGEFCFFDYYYRRIRHRKVLRPFQCTCGQEFTDCEFWQNVLKKCGVEQPCVPHDGSNVSRFVWLTRFIRFRLRGGRATPPAGLGDQAEILAQVLEEAGPGVEYVCDSSKDFAHLVRLAMNPRIEVIPIHLVRDGRAVAHSYTKKKRYDLGFKRTTYLASLINWAVINLINIFIFRLGKMRAVRVSYDRFCRRPDDYVRFFNKQLGLRIPEPDYLGAVNRGTYHNIGGNLLRFKKHEAIRAQTQWREHFTTYKKVVTSLFLTNVLNRRWVAEDSVGK